MQKSDDTLKDIDDSRNDTYFTIGHHNQTDDTYHDKVNTSKVSEKANGTLDASQVIVDCDKNASVRGTYFVNHTDMNRQTFDRSVSNIRGTYFVRNSIMDNTSNNHSSTKENDDSINSSIDFDKSNTNEVDDQPQTVRKNLKSTHPKSDQFELLDMTGNTSDVKSTRVNDISVGQFEQLEMAANTKNLKTINDDNTSLDQFERLEKAAIMEHHTATHANDISLAQFEQLDISANTKHLKTTDNGDASLDQFEKLERASTTKQLKATYTNDVPLAHFEQLKVPMDTRHRKASDVSLAQFEKLEMAANSKKHIIVKDTAELLSNIKTSKQNCNFFDDKMGVELVQLNVNKNNGYLHIDVNIPNKFEESKKILDDRSPSIVKEDIGNFEPNTFKKLLGESFTRSEIISSAHKNIVAPKKQVSVDIFEGFDSPNILKPRDNTPLKVTCNSDVELVSKSTEKRKFFNSMLNENASASNINSEKNDDTKDIALPNKTTDDHVFVKPKVIGTVTDESRIKSKVKISILETCIEKVDKEIEVTRKSIEQMVLVRTDSKSKFVTSIFDTANEKSVINLNETADIHTIKQNNTIDEFENIYKDITVPRATEFDLLVSQNSTMLNETHATDESEKPKYNLRHKGNINEGKSKPPKRNLRLRRRNNQKDDSTDQEEEKTAQDKDNPKLKDIINLQKEFSDVTMDVPAAKKEIKDIQSPEKKDEGENMPPLGIQSCPSKRYVNILLNIVLIR